MKLAFALIANFLWIGFVCAISFMEAWIKFRAPGVTVPIGLGIGRLVFSALNKVEWAFAIIIVVNLLWSDSTRLLNWEMILFLIPLIILFMQSVWLLPALDVRAEACIQGKIVPSSSLHLYYVAMEVIKTLCLLVFGLTLLEKTVI